MEGLAASVVLMAILLGVLLLVAFDLFCLVHLAAAGRVRFLPKLAWAVVIVCVSPFGGAVYLLCQWQSRRSADPPARSRAPSHATLVRAFAGVDDGFEGLARVIGGRAGR